MYRIYDLKNNPILKTDDSEELKSFLANYNEETKELIEKNGVMGILLIMNGTFENNLKTIRAEKISTYW